MQDLWEAAVEFASDAALERTDDFAFGAALRGPAYEVATNAGFDDRSIADKVLTRIGRNAELMRLIFDSDPGEATAPNGPMGEAFLRRFPIPMVWTGINFVLPPNHQPRASRPILRFNQ